MPPQGYCNAFTLAADKGNQMYIPCIKNKDVLVSTACGIFEIYMYIDISNFKKKCSKYNILVKMMSNDVLTSYNIPSISP